MVSKKAGKILKKKGYIFDIAFISVLKRAIKTLWYILDEMDLTWISVYKTWRLNERHYGALQDLNKAEVAKKYGEEQVLIWRRSYDIFSLKIDLCVQAVGRRGSSPYSYNPKFHVRHGRFTTCAKTCVFATKFSFNCIMDKSNRNPTVQLEFAGFRASTQPYTNFAPRQIKTSTYLSNASAMRISSGVVILIFSSVPGTIYTG